MMRSRRLASALATITPLYVLGTGTWTIAMLWFYRERIGEFLEED
jgi:hypothetical protein